MDGYSYIPANEVYIVKVYFMFVDMKMIKNKLSIKISMIINVHNLVLT